MARDCEELSPNARKLFDQIKAYFPLDPWLKPQSTEDGKVFENIWYDLRKSSDRDLLAGKKRNLLGVLVELSAIEYKKQYGSLLGFANRHLNPLIAYIAELLLLLTDLDFQIETLDLVE